MDTEKPSVHNCLVEDDKICQVALTEQELTNLEGDVQRIDLEGKTLLPGFHDSHMHLVEYAYRELFCVNLEKAVSIDDVIFMMKKHIRERQIPENSWVVGMGWNHEHFKEKRLLTKEDLDRISDKHFIFAKRCCIHIAAVNTKTAEHCRLKTEAECGNQNIGRDMNGEINGIVYEAAINDVVLKHMPPMEEADLERLILFGTEKVRETGLTSIQSDDMKAFPDLETKGKILKIYDKLRNEGKLPVRVTEQLQIASLTEYEDLRKYLQTIREDDFFSFGNIKLILDGSLGSGTAAVQRPYKHETDNYGKLNFTDEQLDEIVEFCCRSGMRLMCHTIGDAAAEQILCSLERYQNCTDKDFRPRFVHCQILREDQIKRMASIGVYADIQPMFALTDADIVESKIDIEVSHRLYAWKSLMDVGVGISGSSDAPVDTFNPLKSIWAAILRRDAADDVWEPEEQINLDHALQLYTSWPAKTIYRENRLGQIKEGYYADFALVDKDPYVIPPDEIRYIKVLKTFCGGR